MRAVRPLLWAGGAALGVVAESALYDRDQVRDWAPDLAAGWSLIACGLVASARRPASRSGALMTATGFAWFAGNFTGSGIAAIGWLSAHALYLYRGPLVHLVLTYPRGRAVTALDGAAVAAGYAAALITPAWRSRPVALVLSGCLVAVATAGYLRAIGRGRRERLAAWEATAFVAAVAAAIAAARLADPDAKEATLLLQQLSLVALASVLLAGLLVEPWAPAGVTDLVVELGETRSGTLRSALARALGDPTLELGYWSPAAGAYLDDAGRPLELPGSGSGRAVTRVARDGHALAALVHDPAVLDDPALVDAVAAASRLAASYARLRADIRVQSAEAQESRRRLLQVADAERQRLERRLRDGAERRLLRIGELLDGARNEAALRRVHDQLDATLAELHELARGLHPAELTAHGLAAALGSLAADSPQPVELCVPTGRLPEEVEVAIWFVCAEALANAAKYSGASRVAVTIVVGPTSVHVEIADDGSGGADPDRGTGLRGLADRLDALGGSLLVESPPAGGTRLVGELPL